MSNVEYNKLVRDKIPDIIKANDKTAMTHIADDKEYWQKLKEKLLEEAREFGESEDPEEIADLLEIILALAEVKGLSREELEKERQEKASQRGAFKKRIILEEVED